MDSQLQQVNRVFLIKFQNNIMACTPFVEELMLNRVTILSVGLIWRGLVSDLINYFFLKGVHNIAGDAGLALKCIDWRVILQKHIWKC